MSDNKRPGKVKTTEEKRIMITLFVINALIILKKAKISVHAILILLVSIQIYVINVTILNMVFLDVIYQKDAISIHLLIK